MTSQPIPLLSARIMHDALKTANDAVDTLMASADPRDGAIIPVLGPTRVGKSEIARRLVSQAEEIKTLVPTKVRDVLHAKLPPQPNGAGIYASVLKEMGPRPRAAETTNSLRDRVYRGVQEWGIKTIILDESNHFAERGSNLTPRAAADHLKALVDETGVNLILNGLTRFQTIIDQNEQLRDRCYGTVLFKPYDWQVDADREAFAGAVDVAISYMEQSGRSLDIEFEDIVRRLYGASGGRVPMMLRILKAVVRAPDTTACITLDDFARVSARVIQSPFPASFFAQEDPDETSLFGSFASVMSEAGLSYDVTTAFGFEADQDLQAAL